MLKICIIFLFNLALFSNLYSFEAGNSDRLNAIQLTDSMHKYSVGIVSEYMEDKSKHLSIEDILQNKINDLRWIKSDTQYMDFGYVNNPYWIRFSAINPENHDIHLAIELDFSQIDLVEFYFPDENNVYKVKRSGDSLPFRERDVLYRNIIFSMTQPAKTEYIYYMRIQTTSPMNLPLWIWSLDLLPDKIARESMVFGLYHGMSVLIILFALLSFITMKEKSYLFYLLWIAAYGFYQISVNGLAYQFLWPESPFIANLSIPLFIFLGNLFCLQFSRILLNIKEYLPVFDKIIQVLSIYSIGCIFLTFLATFTFIMPIAAASVMTVMLFLLITGIIAWYGKSLIAKYYVMSVASLFLGGTVFAFKIMGIFPDNSLTNYSQEIGATLHIIVLSFAFGNFINIKNKEIQQSQKNTIDALREAGLQKDKFLEYSKIKNQEIEKLNAELEKRIIELNDANDKISLSEEKYRILVEGSNDIIFSLDENLRFKTINKAVGTHLNIQPADIISREFLDIIHVGKGESGVTKNIIHEKLESFLNDKKEVSFKSKIISTFPIEPKEMNVHLEHIAIEGRNEIIGKATNVEDDLLAKFIDYEKQKIYIGNNLFTAVDISHRITRNLVKYLDQDMVHVLRIGVCEIIINAIEHGNLGISFEEKSVLMDEDIYFDFILQKQKDPEYYEKKVGIEYSINRKEAVYTVTDQGDGFDHEFILSGGAVKANEEMLSHGRGIQMAKYYFDGIFYNDIGNQVTLKKRLSL